MYVCLHIGYVMNALVYCAADEITGLLILDVINVTQPRSVPEPMKYGKYTHCIVLYCIVLAPCWAYKLASNGSSYDCCRLATYYFTFLNGLQYITV